MRLHVRSWVAIAGGLLAVAVAVAAPAQAGSLTTTNACLYSVNGEYRDQAVKLSGVGSPRDVAAGATATLSGASITAALPASLPKTGYDLGIFKAGLNQIPSRVWLAIAVAHATPATQVRELSVTASTTIKVNAAGAFTSGTPIVVTIPIPNSTWTADGTGPVAFSQAGPGTLPNLPVGLNDSLVAVSGSIVVKPKLANLRFVMDCQPGSTAAPFKALTPAVAAPFAGLEADAPVVAGKPKARIATTKLKALAARVGVSIACPAGSDACRGRVSLRSAPTLRGRILTLAKPATYTVAAGTAKTVRLTLNPIARKRLAERRTLRTRVILTPASGVPVRRDLTLLR